MTSEMDNASDDEPIEEVSTEQVLEQLYDVNLSIFSFLIATTQTAAIGAFVAVSPLYGLAAIDALGPEHFPELIQQSTHESGVNVAVRLVYLAGPLVGVFSLGIYFFIKNLDRIVLLRAVDRNAEEPATRKLIEQSLTLVKERSRLGDQVANWEPGDPTYDAYREADVELDRTKRELLGPMRASRFVLLVLVAFNWYAIGLQFYYGIQWGFFSKWLAVPILIIWIAGTLVSTIRGLRGNR